MARLGFIHGKTDIKMLTLYILSHIYAPIDFANLTDLAMCDEGVDYFLFAEGVSELLDSGLVEKNNELFIATEKGRRSNVDLESSLSPVIRKRCDQRIAPLNVAMKRQDQVKSIVTPMENGSASVTLTLDDDDGLLFSLTLLAGSVDDGEDIAKRFSAHPDRIYNGILGVLLHDN